MSTVAPDPAGIGTSRLRLVLLLAPVLAFMAWHAASVAWLCDDAFISFRYVYHLVHGNGLVFNPGERVEGYTNFAWVLELGAIWKVLGVPPEVSVWWLSGLVSVLAIVVIVALALRGPVASRRTYVAFGALLLLATSRTWVVWCTSGLETRQFTLFVLLGLFLVGTGLGRPGRLVLASLSFAAAEYTRPEGPLLWGFAGAWLLGEMAITRRFSWRDCLAYGVPFVAIVGAHFLWRHAYYDDWLPNTYYAKHVRPWPESGVRYYGAALIETGAWFLIPFAVVGSISRARRGDRTHVLAAAVIAAHVYYLVQIGGDHFEMRPLDFYWPLLAIAAVEGMIATGEAVAARLGADGVPSRARATTALLLGAGVFYGSVVQSAKVAFCLDPKYDTRANSQFLYVQLDPDASWTTSLVPPMKPLVNVYNELQDYCLKHGVGVVWREHEVFWRTEVANWGPYERVRGKGALPPDAVHARGSIGIFGYYFADLTVIDQLGLADKYVARIPAEKLRPNSERYMAHDKKADHPYLWSRGLNIVIEPAARTRRDALNVAPYALDLGGDLWMPFHHPVKLGATPEESPWIERAFRGRNQWRSEVDSRVGCFQKGVDPGWTTTGAFARGVQPNDLGWNTWEWPLRCPIDGKLASGAPQVDLAATGAARSPWFVVAPESRLESRLAGTPKDRVGLRVIDRAGATLVELRPRDPGFAITVHADLTDFAGRDVAVELFDESQTGFVAAMDVVTTVPRPLDHE